MRLGHICFLLLIPGLCGGQVQEDFSDGEFLSSPIWQGSSDAFRVASERLQLFYSGSGVAYLSTPSRSLTEAIWEIEVEIDFNPSSRNFCRIYLTSDSPDLTKDLKGYYLQLGGSKDEISVYRQDISKHLKIIDGPDGVLDKDQSNLVLRVTRDQNGNWEVYVGEPGDKSMDLVGKAQDQSLVQANFFGIYCQFTSSRSTNFYFDNMQVTGGYIEDNEAPQLAQLQVIDQNTLEVELTEPIQLPDLKQLEVEGIGNPSSMVQSGYNIWELKFPKSFETARGYLLKVNQLMDFAGNQASFSETFQFWTTGQAHELEVVITEIMADPEPPLQLPDKEYLEIYNRSETAFNLLNWTLSDATKSVTLPNYIIPPKSYLVLCPRGDSTTIISFDQLELASWPSLNNSGDMIYLADSSGQIIHFVNYQHSWYRSELKQLGGWSLKMIDTNYPCSGALNWTASTSLLGGTPGFENSVTTDNPDLTPPIIIGTFASGPTQIKVGLDQLIDEISETVEIEIQPGLEIDSVYRSSPIKPELFIQIKDSLDPSTIYQLTIKGLADCNGNVDLGMGTSAPVALAQAPAKADLIINEVLFNPRPLGARFVELYNNSSKALNLRNWKFARWTSGGVSDLSALITDDHMIYPGEYRVFTESLTKVIGHYPNSVDETTIVETQLPVLGDKEGSILLLSPPGMLIDSFYYHQDMHHQLLAGLDGVSLERASPFAPSNDPNNWYSASEFSGYATPGTKNSQYHPDSFISEFHIDPKLISLNSIGHSAYAKIFYQMAQPGASGSLYIYNQRGRLVRTLVNSSLLSTKGSFQWDGTDDLNLPVSMGNYLVLFVVSLSNGSAKKYLQTVVVAPRF